MAINRIAARAVALALAIPCAMPLLAADKEAKPAAADEKLACDDCPDYRGTQGWGEVGGLNQSDPSYRFGRYSGLTDDGTMVNASGSILHRGDGGLYYEAAGSNLGLDSRDARVEAGRQGKYRVSVEYDETPFRENDETSTPFRKLDANHLGLPLLWQDGLTTQDMPLLPFARNQVDLETQRKKGASEFSYIPMEHWEITGSYSREKKSGTNDQGATFGFDNTVILPVPVDYQTDDYDLGVGYTGKRLQVKVGYHGSAFDDKYDSVSFRNPFAEVTDYRAFGRMSTPPDNQLNQLNATVGYDLMANTRLTGKLSYGQLSQNNELLPYTTNRIIPVGGLTIGMLNSGVMPPATRALQRAIAPDAGDLNAQVNSTLAKLQLTSRPTPKLRVTASYTYSDRDNQTNQIARYYAATDWARSSNPRVNLPYGFTQQLGRLSAGYRLPLHSDLQLGVDYDRTDRTYQEVDQTNETTGWAKLKIKPVQMVEATLDYAHGRRDASDYQRVYAVYPPQNRLQRLSYLNGRDRDKVGGSIAVTPLSSLTITGSAQRTDDSYDADRTLGLRDTEDHTYTVDVTFSPIEALSTHAYYTWEKGTSLQAGGQNRLFPEWTSNDDNTTDTVGVGGKWTTLQKKLELSADAAWVSYQGRVDFNQYQLPALGYPDQGYDLVKVDLKARYKINNKLSVGLAYRHEHYNESQDWASEGILGLSSVVGLRVPGQQDYDVDLVSADMRYQF